MRLLRIVLVILASVWSGFTPSIFPQDVPTTSLPLSPPKLAPSSLKVCLRLQNQAPFLGVATLRVLPEEGYEVLGAPDREPGEFLYSDLAPGKYTLEVSAPGYLAMRVITVIESGGRQRTIFLSMKPWPAPNPPVTSSGAATPPLDPKTPLPAQPAALEPDPWNPHGLALAVPPVNPQMACPLEQVLSGVGRRMAEYISTLEKFTATEVVEHYPFDASGKRKKPETRKFAYVVSVNQDESGFFRLEEYRNGSDDNSQFPAHTASIGLPALDLVFHPSLATDFDFQCEGLGQWAGHYFWQVHFAQRINKPVRIRIYTVNERTFPVMLEGRAWIDPGNYQVVHLETELLRPIPEIGLTLEHISLDYAPVQFRSTGQELWLPQLAELYVERHQRRYYRRHTFSEFALFNVDTSQTIRAPRGSYTIVNLSDRDLSGELTVTPATDTGRQAITLRVNLPAHGSVVAVVGPGKDVDLPPELVGSATLVHNGKPGEIKIEAHLVNGNLIDVIP